MDFTVVAPAGPQPLGRVVIGRLESKGRGFFHLMYLKSSCVKINEETWSINLLALITKQ